MARFLDDVAEAAAERGIAFETMLAEVERVAESEYRSWLDALGAPDGTAEEA